MFGESRPDVGRDEGLFQIIAELDVDMTARSVSSRDGLG